MIPTTLVRIEQLNETTFMFWLRPEKQLDYTAGQFVELSLAHQADERGTQRWFTLSSSPSEELISITTRQLPRMSSFKQRLFQVQPGDILNISQIMGDFVLPMQRSIPIIFLVRGIGITPVRSMLKYLHDTNERRDITLIHSTKHNDDFLFESICKKNATTYIKHVSQRQDAPQETLPMIIEAYNKQPLARIYISGPEQFVEKSYELLRANDVPTNSLVTDYFHGYDS